MAITNAQQYKQLLAKGGRTGFFIGGNFSTESTKDSQKSTSKGSTGTKYSGGDNNYNYRGPADLGVTTRTKDKVKAPEAYEIIGGDRYDVTGDTGRDNKEERRILNEIEKDKKEKIKDTFVTTNNTPDYLPGYLKFLAGLNNTPNRRYFYENVVRAGKYPGLNYGMTAQQLEEEYEKYMDNRMAGKTDAMGNPIPGFSYNTEGELTGNFIDNGGGDNNYIPPIIPDDDQTTPEDPTQLLSSRILGSQFDPTFFAAKGGRIGAMDGGIMNIEDLDREAFFLGGIAKGLKKAVRGVKKLAKSPIGKAAILGAVGFGLGGKGALGSFFGKGSFNPFLRTVAGDTAFSGLGTILSKAGLVSKAGLPTFKGGIALTSLLPLLAGKKDDDEFDIDAYYAANQLTPGTTKRQMGSEFDFYNYNLAEGGMPSKEPVAKKVMPLLDMDGMEKDYRAEGGFVPIGRMEKADDVPARLSKNEFVFTADAVRNAGEGDVDKGAEVMYNMMKNLESGGEISEESQGLDGAREMFQTSQRLGEVI